MDEEGRIEAGYKASFGDMKMRYEYSYFNDTTGWVSHEDLKNQYDYTDQLYAAYGIYGNSFGKLKYQAGLRFEQVWTKSKVFQTNTDYNSSYSEFYPSLHTQYDLGKERELQFSYSRRVQRPSPRELVRLYANVGGTAFVASGLESLDLGEMVAPLAVSVVPALKSGIPGLSGISALLVKCVSTGAANAFLTLRVGEVARLMARKYGDQSFKESDLNKDLGDEMADVLFVLICLANQTGTDLNDAFRKSLEKKTLRDGSRHLNNPKLR